MCIPYMWWTYRHMIDGMRMRRSPNEERERANRSAPASTFGWAAREWSRRLLRAWREVPSKERRARCRAIGYSSLRLAPLPAAARR